MTLVRGIVNVRGDGTIKKRIKIMLIMGKISWIIIINNFIKKLT